MAKVKGPLFSLDAAGRIADALTFGRSKSGALARSMVKPAGARVVGPTSSAQALRRALYTRGVQRWRGLTEIERSLFSGAAAARQISPYNAFISAYLSGQVSALAAVWDAGATAWDAGATFYDMEYPGIWDAGAATWDAGATLWNL